MRTQWTRAGLVCLFTAAGMMLLAQQTAAQDNKAPKLRIKRVGPKTDAELEIERATREAKAALPPLSQEDVLRQLTTLATTANLGRDELHALLDQAHDQLAMHKEFAETRERMASLLSQHQPDKLADLDSMLQGADPRKLLRELERQVEESQPVSKTKTAQPQAEPSPPASLVFKAKYIIIGAGPAGLQLGYFMQQAGRDYMILERDLSPGAYFKKYPRHRQLISINKRFAGDTSKEFHMRHDWNSLLAGPDGGAGGLPFANFSTEYYPPADAMVQYLGAYATRLGLRVRYATEVSQIARSEESSGHGFTITDKSGNKYICEYVIVATGLAKQHIPPHFKGAEHVQTYENMSLDRADYKNQKVLIVGKGNAAFETAWHLMPVAAEVRLISRNPVRLAPLTHYVGDLRVVNDEAFGAYQLKSLVSLLDTDPPIGNTTIVSTVEHNEDGFYGTNYQYSYTYERVGGDDPSLYRKRGPVMYDKILLCTGFEMDQSIFASDTKPEMDYRQKYAVIGPDYESSIPGMYVAGTLGHYRDWRKSSGGFVHGFRYTVRALHRWLEQAHESTAWPSFLVKTNPEKIAKQILGRLSEASGIYQMFGELGELVVVTPKGSRYFEEVPVKLLPQMLATVGLPKSLDRLQFYTVVLEYGRCFKEEAVILRNRYCGSASCYLQTNQIHPVIRYYDYPASALSGGQIDVTKPLREFHLTEDLNTRWLDKDRFLVPAMTFLARTLGMAADDSSNIPLLIAERDVHAPLPSCELERVGQLLHDKYEKLFATDPVLARFMLLQAVKFKPDLAQKHWDDTARATLTGLLQAQPVDSTLAACSTAGPAVEECVDAAAHTASLEELEKFAQLDGMEDLGIHPNAAKPQWATPQSLRSWKLGNYPDRYSAIGSAVQS